MSSTPAQCKRWRARYPQKVRAYRATDAYRRRQNLRRRAYNKWRIGDPLHSHRS